MIKNYAKEVRGEGQDSSVRPLLFRPALGLTSPHIQTILPTFLKAGEEPPSAPFFISLEDGDTLCCMLSTPPNWNSSEKTIVLIHGLGGTHASSYMIRLSRKFYQTGYRCVRVNLRGTNLEGHVAQRPYHGGTSQDVLQVISTLKRLTPHSPLILIGFSLGGNIALKLMGELGENARSLIESTIAVCAPVDLAQTTHQLLERSNRLYHHYYLRRLRRIGTRWIGNSHLDSIIDFDHQVTAAYWGYQDAFDYYRQCSSKNFLPLIKHSCHLIFAADDPFVDYRPALQSSLSPSVNIWISPHGGHMGFLGWAGQEHRYWWLDSLLFQWIGQSKNENEKNEKQDPIISTVC